MNCIIDKQSAIAKAIQYVLIELFRNVFFEKTMIESKFPIDPMVITPTSIAIIATTKFALDIFSIFQNIMIFHLDFTSIYIYDF